MNKQGSIQFLSSVLDGRVSADGIQEAGMAALLQAYPYLLPVRYAEAKRQNGADKLAPATLAAMLPYAGNWILFCDFVNGVGRKQPAQQNKQAQATPVAPVVAPVVQPVPKAAPPVPPAKKYEPPAPKTEVKSTPQPVVAATTTRNDAQKNQPAPVVAKNTAPPAKVNEVPEVVPPVPPSPAVPAPAAIVPEVKAPQMPAPTPAVKNAEEPAVGPEIIVEKESPVVPVVNEPAPSIAEKPATAPVVPVVEPGAVIEVENRIDAIIEAEIAEAEVLVSDERRTEVVVEPIIPAPVASEVVIDLPIEPVSSHDYFLHKGVKVPEDIDFKLSDLTEKKSKEEADKALMVVMSFSEWLLHFKHAAQKQEEETKDQKALKTMWQKEKLAAAMEEENEEIPENVFEMAVNSISKEEGMASETLANIYIKQGKFDQAIEMYRKLSLRNPQKNAYFARKIEEALKDKQS